MTPPTHTEIDAGATVDERAFNAAIAQFGFNSQPALREFLKAYLAALPASSEPIGYILLQNDGSPMLNEVSNALAGVPSWAKADGHAIHEIYLGKKVENNG